MQFIARLVYQHSNTDAEITREYSGKTADHVAIKSINRQPSAILKQLNSLYIWRHGTFYLIRISPHFCEYMYPRRFQDWSQGGVFMSSHLAQVSVFLFYLHHLDRSLDRSLGTRGWFGVRSDKTHCGDVKLI